MHNTTSRQMRARSMRMHTCNRRASMRAYAYTYAHTHIQSTDIDRDNIHSMLRKNGQERNDGDCEAEQDPAVKVSFRRENVQVGHA